MVSKVRPYAVHQNTSVESSCLLTPAALDAPSLYFETAAIEMAK